MLRVFVRFFLEFASSGSHLIYVLPLKKVCAALITEKETRARGYKTFFMLNSAEHEILFPHKY